MSKYQKALNTIQSYHNALEMLCEHPHVDFEQAIKTLQELVDEAIKSIKPTKTTKHSWCKDEYGDIDIFGYSDGFCNGPKCEICGYSFCHHCYPNRYSDKNCNEHYICECGQHLKGTEKRCPNCDNLLDWSDN